jgi:predicted outer membrane repeat protein
LQSKESSIAAFGNVHFVSLEGGHVYLGEGFCALTNVGVPPLRGVSLFVFGNNATVDCQRKSPFATWQASDESEHGFPMISVHDLTLKGCMRAHGDGGCIRLDFDADSEHLFVASEFRNCQFQDAEAADGSGGAIAVTFQWTSVSISDCSFTRCLASQSGGAVFAPTSMVTALRTEFTQNTARRSGGALFAAAALVDSCELSANTAGFAGGAVFLAMEIERTDFADRLVRFSLFANNSAETSGGAIACVGAVHHGDFTLHAKSTSFVGNVATRNGGALSFSRCETSSARVGFLQSNSIEGNVATFGGGVYVDEHCLVGDEESIYSLNLAVTGGAMMIDGGGATLQSCTFAANTAAASSSSSSPSAPFEGDGGALFLRPQYLTTLGLLEFGTNRASRYGGAVALYADLAPPASHQFYIDFKESVFTANRADVGGGGLFVHAMTITNNPDLLEDSVFVDNVAGEHGGAVWLDSCKPVRVNFSMPIPKNATGNSAGKSGGALYFSESSDLLFQGVLRSNEPDQVACAAAADEPSFCSNAERVQGCIFCFGLCTLNANTTTMCYPIGD